MEVCKKAVVCVCVCVCVCACVRACVRVYVWLPYIFIKMFGIQSLADVKENLIQTEAISIQSPLRDGIITGHLLHT